MNKRKLATLVAASFAGLMLSSPLFATHADKAQTISGGSTSAQATASASDAPESRSIERADGASASERAQDKAVASANAKTDAEAEYKAALEKCDAQPAGQRSACVQDAEKAQTLAMQQSRDGTSASGAPQESHRTGTSKPSKPDASDKRATERAEDKAVASAEAKTDAEKADKSDASSNTATKNQTDSNTSRKTGAPESRSAERTDERAVMSKEEAAAAKAEYEVAVQKCDALPSGERGSCVQDAKDAQSLAMNKGPDGSPATSGAPESRIVGPQSAK